ncbi:MAG TPA: hypothetical protein VKP04_09755, partial [Ktedonobacteraceae bacterium]|nr:hypothetical protein [Ktedonobacteraceae bacterium]
SFHHYSKSSTSWATLVSNTQGQNTTGYSYLFQDISAYVRNGKQPNPGQTPIYLDEYNGSPCSPVNCPADPTYGPLWNALLLVDLLNTVLIPVSPNGLAQNPPAGLSYFTWNEPPGGDQWCMFGTIDTNYDCALTGPIQPYPQYYAYQLFGGANFLNITDGGYVANAVTTNLQGVYATGFYTSTKDNLVIVNTSATAYTNLTIGIQNPGKTTATTATVFTLNRANPQIATSQATIQESGNGYMTVVSLPAYTTVALSIDA